MPLRTNQRVGEYMRLELSSIRRRPRGASVTQHICWSQKGRLEVTPITATMGTYCSTQNSQSLAIQGPMGTLTTTEPELADEGDRITSWQSSMAT